MEIYDSEKYRCIVLSPLMKSEDVNDKYSTADYMRDSFRKEFFFGVGDSVNIHLDTWKDNIKGSFAEFEFENISEENTYFPAKKVYRGFEPDYYCRVDS